MTKLPLSLFPLVIGMTAPLCGQVTVSYSDITRLDKSPAGEWKLNSGSTESLLAGTASSSSDIFETAVLVDISTFDTEIASASSISFNIAYDAVLGAGQNVTAYLFGTNTGSVATIGGQEFHDNAFAGSSGGTILSGDFSAPGVASYDVTAILKGLTGSDYVGILLTAGITTNPNTGADDISFYDQDDIGSQPNGGAYLSISSIPEPEAFSALLGCMSVVLMVVVRRRR